MPAVEVKEEAGKTTLLVEVAKQEAALLMTTPVAAAVVEELGCPVVGSALALCSLGHWQWQARWRAR